MTALAYENMKTSELVAEHNRLAKIAGATTVLRFSDKTTAIRRTKKMADLAALKQEQGTANVEAEQAVNGEDKSVAEAKVEKTAEVKKERKKRGMRFVFPIGRYGVKSCKPNTLRDRARVLMLKGCKFPEIEALVVAFDEERERPSVNVERRAYELVRIMHYYLGYRISHDKDNTGQIQLHEE